MSGPLGASALPRPVVADLIGIHGEPRDNIVRWGEAAFTCSALRTSDRRRTSRAPGEPGYVRGPSQPIDHRSFGYGSHTSAGRGLARLEAQAVIASFSRRVRSFEIGPFRAKINNATRSLDSLPVVAVLPATRSGSTWSFSTSRS